MNISGRSILLIVAIVIAAFTVFSMQGQIEQKPEATAPASVRVVIAKRDLAPGTFVQGSQDLEFGELPPHALTPAPEGQEAQPGQPQATPAGERYLREDSVKLSDFNGAVVRRTLKAGDAVPQSALMRAGEGGFMSAVLEPGMRAVSIAVNATTGNAGFVSPGDRVDLIVTHRIKKMGGGEAINEESVVSETFVRDLRVVAVDQMLDNPENKAILAKTVTVECSSRQAEHIAVATEMGKISVALRSIASAEKRPENETQPKESGEASPVQLLFGEGTGDGGFTRDSDLSQLLDRKALMVPRVQVLRGDKSETIDFVPGH
jgi:pilus assembly protein CpaB